MERSVGDDNKWMPALAPAASGVVRLFCLPYAGGGASIYRQWPRLLSRRVSAVPLRLPGREMRILDAPIDTLSFMLDALVAVLRPHIHQPYALFGHSMGALIAHELTQRLRAEGLALPLLLGVSGRQAPHVPNPAGWESVRGMSDARFSGILTRINAATETVLANPALYELLLPTLRADFSLCEDHQARPPRPLPLPIIAFGGTHDPSVSLDAVGEWARHTTTGFSMNAIDGDHFFINGHATQMCRVIEQYLFSDQVQSRARLSHCAEVALPMRDSFS
ncbi:surfactin synthase thioesterase subunit [Xanthomonas arboricola]|uniref:thioesterase II family protein n=1 Tax=Xanthomonas euroxanthea TaxID=2259622 RepID=UPI0016154372|nr:alpha/beta fold hydrolase [Xanthomonas euroxanthea]MBB3811697.1 surfactin synthase thioesterase subunit [Xanthomonas euroxanthea]